MKTIRLTFVLMAAAIGGIPTAPAQDPAPPPVRTLPTPIAPPAFPTLPVPGATTNRLGTNRPSNIQFTPRTQGGIPPLTPPGSGAVSPAGAASSRASTNSVTPEAIRAATAAAAAAQGANPNVLGAVGADPAAAGAPGAGGPAEELLPPGLIKFSEADLNQVLDIYQELTGRTVVRAGAIPAAKITVKSQTALTRAEAKGLLETLLAMNQITMVNQGDKFVKAVPQAQSTTEGARFDDLPGELYPESATFVTHIVQLKNAAPNDLVPVLEPFAKMQKSILTIPSTSMLVIRDYAENVKRMLEIIEKIDVIPPQDFLDVVIPIKYALASDIANVLSSLTAGGGSATTVGQQQTRTGLTSGGLGSRGGIGGVGGAGGLGQPGYNPNNPFGQQQTGAGGLGAGGAGRSSFAQRLNNIVNRAASGAAGGDIFVLGQTKIIADERTNSLLIFASKGDLITISNIIGKLDVVLAQVLIESIVMEVKVGDDLSYGFSYLQKNPTTFGNVATGVGAIRNGDFLNAGNFLSLATNAAGGLPGGFSYAASFMDFDATVTAMARDSRVNVVSRPRIQTSHAVEANLFVGQTRPYVTGQYSYFGGGGPQTQFQQQQIGLTLSVLPLINAEGLVVMDINVKVQNIGENIQIDANFSVPETIDREAAAKVAVRDRETIMLGGFISKRHAISKSGVPILKDIPILGKLFSANSDNDERVELIILIRPTVLPSPKDASLIVAEEKRKMPAVRQAERDYIEDTNLRMEADDRAAIKDSKRIYKREGFSR